MYWYSGKKILQWKDEKEMDISGVIEGCQDQGIGRSK